MDNQEAIKILTAKAECMRRETSGIDIDCNHRNCDECDLCYKQGTTGDQRKALGVAISALQAQDVPDTNVGDTVSRKAAIDAIVNTVSEIGLHDNSEVARYGATFRQHEIIDIIEGMPSAEPETCEGCKHLGKWENEVEYGYPSPCTRCKRRVEDHYER